MDNRMKTRIAYQKKGRAKYISHLDINRLMQRVLKRTGLPVWYTEGFNPHMYLNFALPLSLGQESEAEFMDFWLTEEQDFNTVRQALNANMPEGITVSEVYSPIHKPAEIGFADYRITLHTACPPKELEKRFSAFFSSDRIEVVKKTKRGEQIVDLKPDITLHHITAEENSLTCEMRFPAGNEKNYNPTLLFDAFAAQTGIELCSCSILRLAVYLKDGTPFR